jgi:hypothetical protein
MLHTKANEGRCESFGQMVGAKVRIDDVVAEGCPVEKPSFVTHQAVHCAQRVAPLLQKLDDINLQTQDELLLVRTALQLRVSNSCDNRQGRGKLHTNQP